MLQFDSDHRAFREELCAFLHEELTPDVRARHHDEQEYKGWSVEYRHEFRRKLGERGFIGMGWPAEYGGGGKDMTYEVIYADEMEYHDGPGLEPAINYVPYALIALASEEQKRTFLPQLRRGELSFLLGYSEPEAGSDLANLSTRAERDGEDFVITGQKSYSSYAHHSHWAIVAARTDDSGAKHTGMSLFLVDMSSPGIELARHRTMSGWLHASVFFDHVVVPAANVLGPLDQGWRALMAAIDYERASLAAPGLVDKQLDRLVAHALRPDAGGHKPVDDAAVRDELVTLAVEAESARLYSYELARRHAQGEMPKHETSLSVLLKRETARLADRLGIELLGPAAQLRRTSPYAVADGALEYAHRDHTYFSFAAGGFDITRNVLATRGLGLPRVKGA
jgi:alkylation response protein AidB-like acyl-CoA dehydrogenase